MADRFVILGQPRTGTNAFIARLNQSPDVVCHYEMFHDKKVYLHEKRFEQIGGSAELRSLAERNDDPMAFLDRHRALAQDFVFGFKLFYHQNPVLLNQLMADSTWRKLIAYRPNYLDQYLSMQIARKTRAYTYDEQAEGGAVAPTIVFDAADFKDFVNAERDILDDYISQSNGDVMLVDFDTATVGDLSRIYRWLGVEQPELGQQVMQKQNPRKTSAKVDNYEALEQALSDTEFEWMINA